VRGKQVVRTPEKEEAFLNAIREGRSAHAAAKIAGTSRSVVYTWREEDTDFARAWHEAYEEATDDLEDVALVRARERSDTLLIFNLKARRPLKYRDSVHNTGQTSVFVTHVVPDKSDAAP
jgi:hypothetical protein